MPIPLDSLTLSFLARDLDQLLRGRQIESVSIGDDRILAISFAEKVAGHLRFLYDPSFPLLCLADHFPGKSAGAHAPRFQDALRGGVISRVEQAGLERVIGIQVRVDGHRAFHLYFELAPPFPNLFLTDQEDIILAVLLRAGTHTRRRTLMQGEPYLPPALQSKTHPFEVDAALLESLAWQEDGEALGKAILGVGPFLSKEIVWRAKRCGSLPGAFTETLEAYRSGKATPYVFGVTPLLSKHPPEIGIAWYKPSIEGVFDLKLMSSLNAAAAYAARAFLRTSAFDRKKASVVRMLAKEIARWEAVEEDAHKTRKGKALAVQFRRSGELILANLTRIEKGASRANLPDIYSETAEEITVPLERHLTPHANADAYFKKARKAERGARLAEETIREARQRLRELQPSLNEAQSAEITYAHLKQIEDQIGGTTATRKEKQERADEKAVSLGIRPRRYVVTEGWTVLVGRSAQENDILSHKYASPTDLWFHARQAQGSHVILRRDRKKAEPSKQAIVDAARIAAYYSKAKTSKHVPVSYTEKRYVKKVRKGAPGLCVMLREKVVFVNPTPPEEPKVS